MAHRIFQHKGLINKYINHSGLNHLTKNEIDFLVFQKEHPWRFSFAEITGRPNPEFFEMYDVFSGESYLLHSPSLSNILTTQHVNLCFNLIAFNGKCWQSFGPIGAYTAFETRDIFFFATELNQGQWMENGADLMLNVEENPVPYMCLYYGSNHPKTFHADDPIVHIKAEYLDDSFNAELLRDRFTVEYSQGVYKIFQPDWVSFPHYSTAYYDEKEKLLNLNAMTDRGFKTLIGQLNECGYEIDDVPDFRVNMAMYSTACKILKKKIKMNRYESLFDSEPSRENDPELNKMNAFIAELLPYLNSGEKPDLNTLADRHQVLPETANSLYEQLKSRLEKGNS